MAQDGDSRLIEHLVLGFLVRRRYRELREAARRLQRWHRSRVRRAYFMALRQAVPLLQSRVRGLLARNRLRDDETAAMLAEEQREIAALQAAEDRALFEANAAFGARRAAIKKLHGQSPLLLFRTVDVDVREDVRDVYSEGWADSVRRFEMHLQGTGQQVASMALGRSHTLLLTNTGDVYSFGDNSLGQLGQPADPGDLRPEHVLFRGGEADKQPRMTRVYAGDHHSLALDASGAVFSWGSGRRGALGHGGTDNVAAPRRLKEFARASRDAPSAIALAAGAHHSVALLDDGSVFTWGAGVALGQGVFVGSGDRAAPAKLESLYRHSITAVAAGASFTLALTSSGRVLGWGSNRHGQLGLSDTRDRNTPTMLPSVGSSVHTIAAGANHCGAVANDGVLYMWGANHAGQLGQGHDEDVLAPAPSLEGVLHVACGSQQTLALCEDSQFYAWGRSGCLAPDADGLRAHQPCLDPAPVPDTTVAGYAPCDVALHASPSLAVMRVAYLQRHLRSRTGGLLYELSPQHLAQLSTCQLRVLTFTKLCGGVPRMTSATGSPTYSPGAPPMPPAALSPPAPPVLAPAPPPVNPVSSDGEEGPTPEPLEALEGGEGGEGGEDPREPEQDQDQDQDQQPATTPQSPHDSNVRNKRRAAARAQRHREAAARERRKRVEGSITRDAILAFFGRNKLVRKAIGRRAGRRTAAAAAARGYVDPDAWWERDAAARRKAQQAALRERDERAAAQQLHEAEKQARKERRRVAFVDADELARAPAADPSQELPTTEELLSQVRQLDIEAEAMRAVPAAPASSSDETLSVDDEARRAIEQARALRAQEREESQKQLLKLRAEVREHQNIAQGRRPRRPGASRSRQRGRAASPPRAGSPPKRPGATRPGVSRPGGARRGASQVD